MVISDVMFAASVLAFFVFFYFKSVYNYWNNTKVTGPKPIPFFGNTMESALRRKHIAVLFKEIYNDFANEKIVGFYRMTSPTLLIRDLDIVKQILVKDFEVFPDRGIEFSKIGLGDNLFHCGITTWKALRCHLTPMFTSEKLKHAVNLLARESDKFVDHVERVSLMHQEQEVTQLFQKYTIASIMACIFGIHVNTMEDNSEVFERIDKSIFTIPRVNEIELLLPGLLKKTNSSFFNKIVIKYCYEVVEAVKLRRKRSTTTIPNIMDALLELQQKGEVRSLKRKNGDQTSLKLTDHVIAGQVLIFFAAGYANNTNILSLTMYHLAKNPDVQSKLIGEIDEILHRFNGDITYESVNEMTYLDQVFNETLRMHPTANSLQRCAARNYVIPGTDIKIERGMTVIISPMAIHHDSRFYPNPQKFDPQRFAPEVMKNRHPCTYLPFGIGPRACIAMRFAKLQFKVCAVKLLSKFRVEISSKTKIEYFVDPHRTLLGPAGGIYLNVIPRSSSAV